jgi:ketosteroid isomerase-like protein
MRQGTKPEDPMSANIRDLVIEYNHAFGDGRLDRVAEMLHPDVVFDGTVGKATRGAAEYMAGRALLFAMTSARSSSKATVPSSSTTSLPTHPPARS